MAPPTGRRLHVRVKSAKGRKPSSTRWLQRQLNDPYVSEAKAKGYRSRAAFKLIGLDEKLRFLKRGGRVLDLGAAPGGWSQVARARVGPAGCVVAADIAEMEPIPGVVTLRLDALAPDSAARLREALGGLADVVLSDMAAPATGHRQTDHVRTAALFEAALATAETVLKPGGVLCGKLFQGGAEPAILARLKKRFREVKHVKPDASRRDSPELYLVARGFRGTAGAS